MNRFVRAPLAATFLIAAVTACGNDYGGPDYGTTLNVSGNWTGTALLPNGTVASMTLQQTNNAVTGTMAVSSAFPQGLPITGGVNVAGRTVGWTVAHGCETWSGVLTVNAGTTQMTGPISINRQGCVPAQANGSGSITLNK